MGSAQTDLVQLVGRFYDAALDQQLWHGVSSQVAAVMDATSGVVKLHDRADQVRLVDTTDNLAVGASRRDWADRWHQKDLWVARAAAAGPGRIYTSQELVSPEEQRRSEFYQEWLRELEIFHMVGTAFSAGDGRLGVFGVHRPRGAAPFAAEHGRRMAMLTPHVARAFELGERLAGAQLAHDVALSALDALGAAVVVIDSSCRIVHLNPAAEDLLRLDVAVAVRENRLVAKGASAQERLASAVRDAAGLAADHLKPPPPPVWIDGGDRSSCTLTVLPLRPRHTSFFLQRPLAVVLLRVLQPPSASADRLRRLFGFTRTEALVAAELAQGRALPQIAARLGVEVATIRTHVKQVLLKTDSRRQAEAVSTLLRSLQGPAGDR